MRAVSPAFLRALTGSHRMVAEARILTTFQMGVDPAGTTIVVEAGDVQMDATADVRSTVSVSTDGNGWDPHPGGLLTPYGNEVFVRRGIDFGEGHREWVSLGYYQITSVEQAGTMRSLVRISGSDRMRRIIDYGMLQPRQFTANHTILQVIESLVLDVYPTLTISYDFVPSAIALNRQMLVEEDRYAALRDVVTGIGKVMFFNHEGKLRIQSPQNPASPVWDVKSGRDGVLVTMDRSLSREGVFNAVIAMGESSDDIPPVRAIAYDNNPNSPTYWSGPFGKVPRPYASERITTKAQAQGAARSLLERSLGLPYQVDLSAVPNPALEPLDPVRVHYDGAVEVHVLDRVTIPLTAEASMTGATREATEQNIGEG